MVDSDYLPIPQGSKLHIDLLTQAIRNEFYSCCKYADVLDNTQKIKSYILINRLLIEEILTDLDLAILRTRWVTATALLRVMCEKTIDLSWIGLDVEINLDLVSLRDYRNLRIALCMNAQSNSIFNTNQSSANERITEIDKLGKSISAEWPKMDKALTWEQMAKKCDLDQLYQGIYRQLSAILHAAPNGLSIPLAYELNETEDNQPLRISDRRHAKDYKLFSNICILHQIKALSNILNFNRDSEIDDLKKKLEQVEILSSELGSVFEKILTK